MKKIVDHALNIFIASMILFVLAGGVQLYINHSRGNECSSKGGAFVQSIDGYICIEVKTVQ